MRILLFTLLLFNISYAQFETSLVLKTELLQQSELVEDERIKLTCKVFNKFVVAEKVEPGFVGNVIYVKSIKDKTDEQKLAQCNEIKLNQFRKIESQGTILWGASNRYLFLKDADELSSRTRFEIFNTDTGKMVFAGLRNNDLLYNVIHMGNNILALEYFHMYDVDCDFSNNRKPGVCWRNFIKSLQPKSAINIPVPDCPVTKNRKKYRVFLKVQIPNIEKPRKKLLYAKPICEVAP